MWPSRADASGLDVPLVGSGQSGPTTVDAAAIHWNPGALAGIDHCELFAGGGLVAGRIGYTRQRLGTYQTPDSLRLRAPLLPIEIDATKFGWAQPVTAMPLAPVGDIFLAVPLNRRVVVGLGAYVPYAATLDYPDDGPQRFRLQNAFIVASHVSASAAARVGRGLSIGGSLTWVSGYASMSKMQDFAELEEFRRAFANPPISQANEFGSRAPSHVRELQVLERPISIRDAISNGITFNAGIMYEPTADLRFGLSYQHGAQMNYRGKFEVDLNDPFFTQDLAAQGLKYPPLVQGEANLAFRLPKRITTGVGYQVMRRLRVDGFVSYVFYSDVDAFVVTAQSPRLAQPKLGLGPTVRTVLPRAWRDTVWVEGNVRLSLTDALLLSATAGYQSPASPDGTIDAASPDGHRLLGGIGGVYRATRWLDVHADARLQGILPRTVTTSQNDVANGRYTMVVGYVGGHLKAKF
ncbi:MAG: outer membrane protein transport protein [Polyangiaceae bacterium]|nr:outer membrane protein transport protein [Polyangiaceae bacterium]